MLQPIIGMMSDRCESRFGRRRPYILVLGLGAFVGISLILNACKLGQLLGDSGSGSQTISILLVGLGVTFLDFSAESTDSPLRALLLDVCGERDQDTGLNIHSFLGGTGSAFGFVVAAINWENTVFNFIGEEMQILYVFSTVVFISTLIVTLTSVKETSIVLVKEERIPLLSNRGNQILELPEEIEEDFIERDEVINKDENERNEFEEEADGSDSEDQPITLKMLYHSITKVFEI